MAWPRKRQRRPMPDFDIAINPTRATLNHTGEMPSDERAEQSVLSAMLLSPEVFQECLLEVDSGDFYQPSNRRIFNTMRRLFDDNIPVDVVTLADALKWRKQSSYSSNIQWYNN